MYKAMLLLKIKGLSCPFYLPGITCLYIENYWWNLPRRLVFCWFRVKTSFSNYFSILCSSDKSLGTSPEDVPWYVYCDTRYFPVRNQYLWMEVIRGKPCVDIWDRSKKTPFTSTVNGGKLLLKGCVKQKSAFEHYQNLQIEIILCKGKLSSGPFLSINTFYSILVDSEGLDQPSCCLHMPEDTFLRGANSFFLELHPFQKGLHVQESKNILSVYCIQQYPRNNEKWQQSMSILHFCNGCIPLW